MDWYKCNINDVKKEEYDAFFNLLEKEKRERILRFKNPDDKKRSICAQMLAKREISKRYGIDTADIVFCTSKNGKPYCKDIDIHFNLSHSGDYAVCALSENPIGIDIQKIVPYNEKTAKKVCSKEELEVIEKSTDKSAEFIKLWTKKEAVMKMKDLGIASIDIKNCIAENHIKTVRFSDYFVSICEK